MRPSLLLSTALVLIAVGVAGLAALGFRRIEPPSAGSSSEARGEWIFLTGHAPSGRTIPTTGGMMMRMSCADCHGLDGRGLRTSMFTSPDITYGNLTDPAGMLEPDGRRGPVFTEEQIKQAITRGVDPACQPLAWPMPRWRLAEAELTDLLAYLKALSDRAR